MKHNLVYINGRGAAFKHVVMHIVITGPTGSYSYHKSLPTQYKTEHSWQNAWQKRARI